MSEWQSEDFYLHLDSMPTSYSPRNTPGDFEVLLPEKIALQVKPGYVWQVALAEISIPNGLYNIDNDLRRLSYGIRITHDKVVGGGPGSFEPGPTWFKQLNPIRSDSGFQQAYVAKMFDIRLFQMEIPEGYYDPETYCTELNRKIELTKDIIVREEPNFWPRDQFKMFISYDSKTRKFHLLANYEQSTTKEEFLFVGNDDLRDLFGCKTLSKNLLGDGPVEYICNFDKNLQTLYFYCSLVKYSLVNDTRTPILRIIQLGNELSQKYQSLVSYPNQRDMMSKTQLIPVMEHLQYYTLENQESIEKISFKLANDAFDPKKQLDFHQIRDKTFVTLHFKQTKL